MTTVKRLAWVGRQHRKVPGVLAYTIAALRPRGHPHGVDRVMDVDLLRAMDARNLEVAEQAVRRGDTHRHRSDRLIPWVASRLREKIFLVRSGEREPIYLEVDIRNLRTFLGDIADWSLAERPDLAGMSVHEAITRMQRWHDRLAAEARDLQAEPGFVVAELADGWEVHDLGRGDVGDLLDEPVVRRRLQSEGRAMGICVGGSTYARDVADGEMEIYSLRDPEGRPHITIEVIDGSIRQFRGKGNSEPLAVYCDRIHPWVAQHFGPGERGEAEVCFP